MLSGAASSIPAFIGEERRIFDDVGYRGIQEQAKY